MKKRAAALAAVILMAGTFVSLRPVSAEEKVAVTPALNIRDFLAANQGKRVSLRLGGGDAIEGIVTKVGDHVVHLSSLIGREYSDALVSIERIEAVIFKAR